jgi:hypothetical protein
MLLLWIKEEQMKVVLQMLGCLLISSATLNAAHAQCKAIPPACTQPDAKTPCSLTAELLLENEKCPESGIISHKTILMPETRQFIITSQLPFKIALIKQYSPTKQGGQFVCNFDNPPMEASSAPFKDTKPGDLGTFALEHDLTAILPCLGCFKMDLLFQVANKSLSPAGSQGDLLSVDPHIRTGGNNDKFFETMACPVKEPQEKKGQTSQNPYH